MCLDCEPENDHGCCEQQMTLALHYGGVVPRIYVRRVEFQLYAVWAERRGRLIAQCIEACCHVNAKASFIDRYFIIDDAEAELDRMFALEDKRISEA